MSKPTEAQKREFWEGYGYTGKLESIQPVVGQKEGKLVYVSPSINLNNLFRWAVDWDKIETVQFSRGDDGCHCWLYRKKPLGKPFYGNGETEAEALFWTLYVG